MSKNTNFFTYLCIILLSQNVHAGIDCTKPECTGLRFIADHFSTIILSFSTLDVPMVFRESHYSGNTTPPQSQEIAEEARSLPPTSKDVNDSFFKLPQYYPLNIRKTNDPEENLYSQ